MEIIDNKKQREKYSKAVQRVEELKKFYKHLAAYIIINFALSGFRMIRNINFDSNFFEVISDFRFGSLWFWWGIGLVFHAFKVFGADIFFGKNWEEKKVKELMDKDK